MSEMNLDCKDVNIFNVPQMSKVSCFFASDVSPPCNLTWQQPKSKFTLVQHRTELFRYLKPWHNSSLLNKLLTGYTINFDNPSRLHSNKPEEHLHNSKWRTKSGYLQLLPIRSKTNLPLKTVFHIEMDRDTGGFRVFHGNKGDKYQKITQKP